MWKHEKQQLKSRIISMHCQKQPRKLKPHDFPFDFVWSNLFWTIFIMEVPLIRPRSNPSKTNLQIGPTKSFWTCIRTRQHLAFSMFPILVTNLWPRSKSSGSIINLPEVLHKLSVFQWRPDGKADTNSIRFHWKGGLVSTTVLFKAYFEFSRIF